MDNLVPGSWTGQGREKRSIPPFPTLDRSICQGYGHLSFYFNELSVAGFWKSRNLQGLLKWNLLGEEAKSM